MLNTINTMKNLGKFKEDTYQKRVTFSKAVLWKDRAISLPPEVVKQFKPRGVKWVEFIDIKKNERWRCDVDTLREHYDYKQVGQEPQYYFPIELFKVTPLKNEDPTIQSKSRRTTSKEERSEGDGGTSNGTKVCEPEARDNPTLFGQDKSGAGRDKVPAS